MRGVDDEAFPFSPCDIHHHVIEGLLPGPVFYSPLYIPVFERRLVPVMAVRDKKTHFGHLPGYERYGLRVRNLPQPVSYAVLIYDVEQRLFRKPLVYQLLHTPLGVGVNREYGAHIGPARCIQFEPVELVFGESHFVGQDLFCRKILEPNPCDEALAGECFPAFLKILVIGIDARLRVLYERFVEKPIPESFGRPFVFGVPFTLGQYQAYYVQGVCLVEFFLFAGAYYIIGGGKYGAEIFNLVGIIPDSLESSHRRH